MLQCLNMKCAARPSSWAVHASWYYLCSPIPCVSSCPCCQHMHVQQPDCSMHWAFTGELMLPQKETLIIDFDGV